jgi:hypothetical protein
MASAQPSDQRVAERRIGEQFDVVPEPDIFRLSQSLDVEKAEPDGLEQREHDGNAEQDQDGDEKDQGGRAVSETPSPLGEQLALPARRRGGTRSGPTRRPRCDGLGH